jgi:hypothetical protein
MTYPNKPTRNKQNSKPKTTNFLGLNPQTPMLQTKKIEVIKALFQ